MSRHPASTVAPFTLLVPVVGILTAWLVRNEHPSWGELFGCLIILVGLGLALGVVDAIAARRRQAGRAVTPVSSYSGIDNTVLLEAFEAGENDYGD